MIEKESAILLANKVLDRPNCDPDDDLSVLARQLLRAREMEAKERAARQSAQASNAPLVGALREAKRALERGPHALALNIIRTALSTLESGEAAADNNRKGAE